MARVYENNKTPKTAMLATSKDSLMPDSRALRAMRSSRNPITPTPVLKSRVWNVET